MAETSGKKALAMEAFARVGYKAMQSMDGCDSLFPHRTVLCSFHRRMTTACFLIQTSYHTMLQALRQLPTIIADNGGYDSSELITQLRAAHAR